VRIAVQYRVINEMVRDRRPSRSVQDDGAKPLLQSNGELISTSDMDRGTYGGSELLGHGVCRAYYRLTDIEMQLTPYVEDVVRSEVPKRTLDEAYESKEAVALAVKSALSIEMQRYGYEIVNALVTDLQPDSNVLSAMNQIEAQRRMRMAAQEKAEADKILIVKAAEADAESKYLSGAGVARQRRAIVDGLKESVMDFNDSVVGTTPSDVMQLMMVTQYLDMLKEVGTKDKATTLFIPHAPSAVNDIQGQMRQGFMEAHLGAQANARPVVARPTRD
jgi:regulator of protease activity HflC (stomatin/prohibitin superfamily)